MTGRYITWCNSTWNIRLFHLLSCYIIRFISILLIRADGFIINCLLCRFFVRARATSRLRSHQSSRLETASSNLDAPLRERDLLRYPINADVSRDDACLSSLLRLVLEFTTFYFFSRSHSRLQAKKPSKHTTDGNKENAVKYDLLKWAQIFHNMAWLKQKTKRWLRSFWNYLEIRKKMNLES